MLNLIGRHKDNFISFLVTLILILKVVNLIGKQIYTECTLKEKKAN